ncbi:MAG: DUF302 domain-containing protein [Comamonadaceae bacterium]|nr:DUF302 domain-containing protein [Comamonadaceae bacterium]
MRFSSLHKPGRHAALPAALAALLLGGCAAVQPKASPAAEPAATASAAPESAAGLVSVPSQHSVKASLDRLTQMAQARGLMVFARVDHSGEAQKVNLPLRPTQVLILGAPKAGTPLMQSRQTTAIDLPLKVLAWEDAQGRTWLSYNDAEWLQQRHGFTPALKANLAGLAKLVDAAAAR